MNGRPTLRDVCRVADVSIYTASRALNGHYGVAAATRERVLRVAADLGYVANQMARNLKHQTSGAIGVLTANAENQYYAVLVDGLAKATQPAGYHCLVSDAVVDGRYSVDREDRFIESLLEHRVAGVVASYAPSLKNIGMIVEWRIPILFVDCMPPAGYEHMPCVTADNHLGSLELGRHLASHGYRKWGFIAHTPTWSTRLPRERGFRDASDEVDASVATIEGGNDGETAHAAVSGFLDSTAKRAWPEVLYASNTPLLHGALRALRERRVAIPSDIAVVAFDEFDWAALLTPPMTVVDQQIHEIGRTAGSEMLELIVATSSRQPNPASREMPRLTQIKPFLRIRESCGCRTHASERRL